MFPVYINHAVSKEECYFIHEKMLLSSIPFPKVYTHKFQAEMQSKTPHSNLFYLAAPSLNSVAQGDA